MTCGVCQKVVIGLKVSGFMTKNPATSFFTVSCQNQVQTLVTQFHKKFTISSYATKIASWGVDVVFKVNKGDSDDDDHICFIFYGRPGIHPFCSCEWLYIIFVS